MTKINSCFLTLLILFSTINTAIAQKDARQAITLTEEERSLVLIEMRNFLSSVQEITMALSKGDMQQVSKSAKKMGMSEQEGMPESVRKKLPMEFKMLGMKTHKAFDQLAMDAKEMEDKQQALEQLGTLMANCVSCHASFKFTYGND